MPLLVKYFNNGIHYVPKDEFQDLLRSGKVEAFKRSSGEWVDPKTGPMRGQGAATAYTGPERRARF